MDTQTSRRSLTYNLPNLLTYGRLAAVPLVVGLLFWPLEFWARWTAFFIFVVAALSDYFDGYLARAFAQQSDLGRMLDPIADKLLVASCLLMLVREDQPITGFAVWAAIVILCREILVSGLREYLAGVRVSVPVSRVAKWKTTVQLVALSFLIVGPAGNGIFPWTVEVGIVLLYIAAALTLYTGFDYLNSGIRHIVGPEE
ncbi:MAG: CDP-diacylglycerol--glycerol-3-phosphate 3-phosphatidyltransferase [Methylobacteriaceae bacterium]|nr:CDP-diacylglycerol--glycerol-3-phosphate 3-phosphatidyltransferase [Methylobacteriaceae bacterium]